MSIPNGYFAEDYLPSDQPPVITSSVRRFNSFIKLLRSGQRYPTMAAVTGQPGIGKTIAVENYLVGLPIRTHTALPASVKVKVKPRTTPKALAYDIVAALKDRPRGRNVYEVADEAADAITRNDLELLFIDEADRLNDDGFDVLRHIFDKTGCPIAVVGLPGILKVIDHHQQFASRVGLRMPFEQLKESEILDTVLCSLRFSHWHFDPNNEEHRSVGKRIWLMVKPSLRKLRNVLQIASQIAEQENAPEISLEMITEAFRWSATTEDQHRYAKTGITSQEGQLSNPNRTKAEQTHSLEQRSEQRQAKKRSPRLEKGGDGDEA
jgi:DNA transposition AAA+ family ATPase